MRINNYFFLLLFCFQSLIFQEIKASFESDTSLEEILEEAEKQSARQRRPLKEKYPELWQNFSDFVLMGNQFKEDLKKHQENAILLRCDVPRENKHFDFSRDTGAFFKMSFKSVLLSIEEGTIDKEKIRSLVHVIQAVSEDEETFCNWALEKKDKLTTEAVIKPTQVLIGKHYDFSDAYSLYLEGIYTLLWEVFPEESFCTEVERSFHEAIVDQLKEGARRLKEIYGEYDKKLRPFESSEKHSKKRTLIRKVSFPGSEKSSPQKSHKRRKSIADLPHRASLPGLYGPPQKHASKRRKSAQLDHNNENFGKNMRLQKSRDAKKRKCLFEGIL